ncbi:MAG: hypothetical protein ACKVQW_16785 [Pyrinomonadaceae bacterium]
MPKKLLALVIIVVFVSSASAQTTAPKPDETAAKLEKEAVEFLRETAAEVGRLRTAENRISFNAELASLMWFHDDKEARAMYGNVVGEFKQLLAQLDAQMNMPVIDDDDMNSGGFLFGAYGKSKAERKLRIAMMVRQQIAMSLAEHAPDLAYNFYYDSINLVTSAAFRKETEQTDKYFENQLLTRIAQFDPGKAAEIATKSLSLSKGFNERHLELLKKLYEKDAKKGAEFGSEILSTVKAGKIDAEGDVYLISMLLEFGGEKYDGSRKTNGKASVYTATELKEIAELLSQKVLSYDEEEMSSAEAYAEKIEKYLPGRAAQIRAKFRKVIMEQARLTDRITRSYSKAANVAANTTADPAIAKFEAERMKREEREKRDKQMMEDIMSLGKKELPKDERAKIIAESRKIISQTPGKDKKIIALSLLAAQVAKVGDKDLADEIMRDAERMVNPEPRNYQDFMLSWMLASGYAEANPDKAFPILETAILRANETISAFIKVAEFIDVNAEMIDEGEFQVGMFGGEMIRGMTRELGMAAGPLKTLARADFTKTRSLTNVFDRTETRVLAKMLVLRAVLDKREIKLSDDATVTEMIETGELDEAPPPPKAVPRRTPN